MGVSKVASRLTYAPVVAIMDVSEVLVLHRMVAASWQAIKEGI